MGIEMDPIPCPGVRSRHQFMTMSADAGVLRCGLSWVACSELIGSPREAWNLPSCLVFSWGRFGGLADKGHSLR